MILRSAAHGSGKGKAHIEGREEAAPSAQC